MSYRTRSARRIARTSKSRFIFTLLLITGLAYATIFWILPFFINAVGFISDIFRTDSNVSQKTVENPLLAPPVLTIPYEATNTASIDIAGYATPNSKIKIYLDDGLKDIVNTAADGTFKFTSLNLNLGRNNIYGKTVDEKDQESLSSKSFKLIYDNQKPVLGVAEPRDGTEIKEGDPKIKVVGNTEPETTVYINDTRVIVTSDGNFSYLFPLNPGDNTITIKSRDKAGNSTEIERKVIFTPQML